VTAVKGGFGELKKPNNSPTFTCNHGNPYYRMTIKSHVS
jgi:hypothetical protein